MNKFIIALAIGLASVSLSSPACADNTIAYSHDTGKGSTTTFGNGRTETYDIAIMVADKALRGEVVKGVNVPLGDMAHISNLKVWLTRKLTLQTENGKKENVADIQTQNADVAQGMVGVALNEPYTIDADTFYVGYSFTIDKADESNKRPFIITTEQHDGGLWIHSSQTYNRSWMDYSYKGSSTMQVMIEGLAENAVAIESMVRPYGIVGTGGNMSVTIANHGYAGIKSIDYSYEIGAMQGSGHKDLASPVGAVYNATTSVELPLPSMDKKGVYPLKLTIGKANGDENADTANVAMTDVDIYNTKPIHRAVVEEYTGTWCGNCPRGFVGMEVMKRMYPADFIGISYHNNDPMEIMASSLFPSNVQKGLPDSWIDRRTETDAYYGSGKEGFGIDKEWLTACSRLAKASVDVSGRITDDKTRVEMEAEVEFPLDAHYDGYKIEWVLVADSLHGNDAKWMQTNYFAGRYSGGEETFPEPEFRKFYDGADYVGGLYYNDVIIASSRLNGTDTKLPTSITADSPLKLMSAFDLAQVVNTGGQPLIQDTRQLHVVALLIDADGNIVNAAKAAVANTSTGITISNNKPDTPAAIYSIMGNKLDKVERGVNIVRLGNGKRVKILRK